MRHAKHLLALAHHGPQPHNLGHLARRLGALLALGGRLNVVDHLGVVLRGKGGSGSAGDRGARRGGEERERGGDEVGCAPRPALSPRTFVHTKKSRGRETAKQAIRRTAILPGAQMEKARKQAAFYLCCTHWRAA